MELSEQMTELWYEGFAETEIDQFEASLQKILDNPRGIRKRYGLTEGDTNMADEHERQFQGFKPKAFRFLKDIKTHNNKAWGG